MLTHFWRMGKCCLGVFLGAVTAGLVICMGSTAWADTAGPQQTWEMLESKNAIKRPSIFKSVWSKVSGGFYCAECKDGSEWRKVKRRRILITAWWECRRKKAKYSNWRGGRCLITTAEQKTKYEDMKYKTRNIEKYKLDNTISDRGGGRGEMSNNICRETHRIWGQNFNKFIITVH